MAWSNIRNRQNNLNMTELHLTLLIILSKLGNVESSQVFQSKYMYTVLSWK